MFDGDFLVIAFADGPGVLSERARQERQRHINWSVWQITGKVADCFSGVMFGVFDSVIDMPL